MPQTRQPSLMTVAELNALLSARPSTTVVDVREPEEFARGHVPGAINLPLSRFDQEHARIGELDGPVPVVCEAGARSAQAVAWLCAQGFPVVDVAGGTAAWREHGLPLA